MCVAYELPLDDIISDSRFVSNGTVYHVFDVNKKSKLKSREQVFIENSGIISYYSIKRVNEYINHTSLICEFDGHF